LSIAPMCCASCTEPWRHPTACGVGQRKAAKTVDALTNGHSK
jgi:hypothetical protein